MIIEVLMGDEPVRFRVRRGDEGLEMARLDAEGNAETINIDWRTPEPGVYSLLIDGRSYDVHVDEDARDPEQLEVHLLSRALTLRASDARKRRTSRDSDGPDGPVQVTAPMPGRVVKLLAPEGTAVTRGDGMIVLEAMKMENELKAPRDGVVASVRVEEGQGVEGGALLATIE
ncbi:MAG: acetyl-CoA carboxylase biotin carboxyl carrier protein subunit [Acidobacteria bacterium]|nr:acetyl-CoA carboxylase biotin carboxyl carrier protein subunit [Acidobacteriota bacterium]